MRYSGVFLSDHHSIILAEVALSIPFSCGLCAAASIIFVSFLSDTSCPSQPLNSRSHLPMGARLNSTRDYVAAPRHMNLLICKAGTD